MRNGGGSDQLVPGEIQPLPSESCSYKLAVKPKKITAMNIKTTELCVEVNHRPNTLQLQT